MKQRTEGITSVFCLKCNKTFPINENMSEKECCKSNKTNIAFMEQTDHNGKPISELDNWFEWLAARIPNLKDTGAYKFWFKQAMDGYSNNSYKFWEEKYRNLEQENKQLKSMLTVSYVDNENLNRDNSLLKEKVKEAYKHGWLQSASYEFPYLDTSWEEWSKENL